MKHIRWVGALLVALVFLTSCLSTEDNRDSQNSTQASLTIGVNMNDPRIAAPTRALNLSPPASITRIEIRVFNPDQEFAVGDILAAGGVLTLTVPPGVPLSVSGAAYANAELLFKGKANIPPLLPGLGASVKLNLEANDGPDFSLPIQIDITASGVQANAASSSPVFSENNHKILFRSQSNNLSDNDTNEIADLFVKDLRSGVLIPVHTSINGVLADRAAGAADMTADGQQIVFDSAATNLDITQSDTNESRDIFLKDLASQRVTRLSRPGRGAPGDSRAPSISQDGRLVVFESAADLLGTGQTGVFLVDTAIDNTLQYIAPGHLPQLNSDGSVVLWYDSAAQALRLRIRATGTTTTVSSPFTFDETSSTHPYNLSADGRFVVFADTGLSGLRPLSFSPGVYLFDRSSPTGTPRLVSSRSDTQALVHENGTPSQPTLSNDGRYVSFVLGSTIYIKDTANEALAALSTAGSAPTLSADGSLIAYTADANQSLYVLSNPLYTLSTNNTPSVETFTLNVASQGNGQGLITSDTGMNCVTGTLCSRKFVAHTEVDLRAAPANENTLFTGWSGACSGTTPSVRVRMDADQTCTATFTLRNNVILSVTTTGRGGGTITSTPSGIECSRTCEQAFEVGTTLRLLATANADSVFSGWSGGCTSANVDTILVLNSATTCSALFTLRDSEQDKERDKD